MARSSFISHTVNGYSRYDVPESKAFTCTPGILYPVRIDFINARDRVTIAQGIDVRSNPLAVPSFNPYTVRLHRFWVPLQLYHPEMRTNSSKFDMNALSLNWIPARFQSATHGFGVDAAFSNSLMSWLRVAGKKSRVAYNFSEADGVDLPSNIPDFCWANADTYLAYWDIVRNYYSFSQWSLYSFAWPASWVIQRTSSSGFSLKFLYNSVQSFFTQCYGNLEFLDAFYESQFYPSSVTTTNNTYNRSNLFWQIINSDLALKSGSYGASGDGFPVADTYASPDIFAENSSPDSQFDIANHEASTTTLALFVQAHPMAVVPSNPDRFSRLMPVGASSAVSTTGVQTIPQLAIASRLQEYKDLLGAGDSRYSGWLETFFASKIEHVDRPKLLFSASQTVNVQVVMNQSGNNNFMADSGSGAFTPLGQQGGAIAFNSQLGRSQSYYFREPGYMIDMLSIRPVYYWAGVTPDYLTYKGSDYFNPIYNDIGYQSLQRGLFFFDPGSSPSNQIAQEPCFNEFRASYDEVLGQISAVNGDVDLSGGQSSPLYSYWVQQRALHVPLGVFDNAPYYPCLFVDISQVNSPFASNVEDNFFVNMSYSVRKKNLINKTFATRLSNR